MTLIDLGDFKLRFDPKEVRINIDGEMIDIGARRIEEIDSVLTGDLPTRGELKKLDKKISNWIIYHNKTGERINAVEFTRIINSQ